MPKNSLNGSGFASRSISEGWAQSAGLRKSVRVSGCHKKEQEVDFDLFSFLKCECDSPPTPRLQTSSDEAGLRLAKSEGAVPRTDKSCNRDNNVFGVTTVHVLKKKN